jgi:membrane fusion protein (multidrug efflux system)
MPRSKVLSSALFLSAVVTLAGATACGGDAKQDAAGAVVAVDTVNLPPQQIAVVTSQEIRSGPSISGSLQAETQATVSAELGGAVLRTFAEAGSSVSAGQELVRIDDSSLRDAVLSAQSGVTTARNQVDLAQREVVRAENLLRAGAVPERQLELAKSQLIGAQAQEADAKARLTSTQTQLAKAVVKAPFSGVVSERRVNAGDIVGPGMPLYTIVNPGTMRLEASVPAEAIGDVRVGAPVEFAISGYPTRKFAGRISAVNPVADAATRQIRLIVTVPNAGGTLVAGLFAEGRVAAVSRVGAIVPTSAVDETGLWALRLKNGKTERVSVTLGLRDDATEIVEIKTGLSLGDTVLVGAARQMSPATIVRISTLNDVKR